MESKSKSFDPANVRMYILYVRSGKTMRQIATECGLTLSAVSRIIANKRRPSLETAVDLSKSLAQPIEVIVDAVGMSRVKARWQLGLEPRDEAEAA